MKLKELFEYMLETDVIALYVNGEWIGIFPIPYCPEKYRNSKVRGIAVDKVMLGKRREDVLCVDVIEEENGKVQG